MRTALWIILFIVAPTLSALAAEVGDAQTYFVEANEAYKNGEYGVALRLYLAADSLADSPAINYNLGNTYYKLKRMPESILYYERALKTSPANEDIRHNLRRANELIVDRIESLPKSKLSIWWEDFRYGMGPDGWAYVSIWLVVLCVMCFFLYWIARNPIAKKFGFFTGMLLLVVATLTYFLARSAETHRNTPVSAVVFTDKVDIKSEPRDAGTSVFVLHAGTKVFILSSDEGWFEIEIASGNVGWIPSGDVREI